MTMSADELDAWCWDNTNRKRYIEKARKFTANDKLTMVAVILNNEYRKRVDSGAEGEGPSIRRPPAGDTTSFPDWMLAQAFGCSETTIVHIRRGEGEYRKIQEMAVDEGVDKFVDRHLTERITSRLREVCERETGNIIPINVRGRLMSKIGTR